jgi:catechol 2,3-dioxygenase-like lactoylglutathione lyase family enzyme
MPVTGFDHAALPTADSERFLAFYKSLGFGIEGEDAWRAGTMPVFAITFGDNKINVHTEALVPRRGDPAYLRGPTAEAGCGDFCFVWAGGIDALLATLATAGVEPIEGPVPRIGGRAAGTRSGVSVYVRDPDENLLEFISYDAEDVARYPRATV